MDRLMTGAEWFGEPLRAALARGDLPKERLSDMVRRILRSIYAVGLDQPLPQPVVDMAEHHATALDVARQGIVLLKNDGVLPIRADTPTIAVIGGYAQLGVVTGAGSSAVVPPGGFAAEVSIGGEGVMAPGRNIYLL